MEHGGRLQFVVDLPRLDTVSVSVVPPAEKARPPLTGLQRLAEWGVGEEVRKIAVVNRTKSGYWL